jgi:ArsR family transcriptional regulator, arsenate/arsenite/antimonite-responsive transcriptional repressor / arsenate reductase (thioredoxin)
VSSWPISSAVDRYDGDHSPEDHCRATDHSPEDHCRATDRSSPAPTARTRCRIIRQKLTQNALSDYSRAVKNASIEMRAARYAALGDPVRLAIVDELVVSDRAPLELRRLVGIESNLLAHHLDVLESVGMIRRSQSSGDGRRRYIHLAPDSLDVLRPGRRIARGRALFVCTRNSARSQLAAALWRSLVGAPADSAGTHPADRIHPGALAAAKRAGLDLSGSVPRALADAGKIPSLVITVCDQAHEELVQGDTWLHWSIADPVEEGTRAAFDAALSELQGRIGILVDDFAAFV